ncbi:hypothetical protein NBRC111894_1214 [Sporolactobacillus inulinus]|uniref:Uncharacterized protein n=1 Tax=Sporolactobacillus inulinus TaxID=2078 RepID=A0A4Y1Z9F3_9BACL|nr:hypothetical protein NBRC111894_1214 [Sporolactobacillus inulinus]
MALLVPRCLHADFLDYDQAVINTMKIKKKVEIHAYVN